MCYWSVLAVQALLRLGGVVLGGASSWQAFLELIRPLQDPIIAQLLDRHALSQLSICQQRLLCLIGSFGHNMISVKGADIVLHGHSAQFHHPQGARAVDCGQLATALCRRSAVSRQACQLICVLSRAMGSQFDSLAVHMMPALFKVLVITVQVSTFLTPLFRDLR